MWQPAKHLRRRLQQWLQRQRRVEEIAVVVTGCVFLLRLTGWLQFVEWRAYDQFFRLRGPSLPDERVVVISIDEADLQNIGEWPIPDRVMAELLQKIAQYEPRAIGLDIYRDLPVGAGQEQLAEVFRTMPHLIGIEMIGSQQNIQVRGPAILKAKNQVGFNNVFIDADGVVRRNLLYWSGDGQLQTSFALQLALLYLEKQGIQPQAAAHSTDLQLGQGFFPMLHPYDGGYVKANMGGYQVLANFRKPDAIQVVSVMDVLEGRVDADLLRDRVVLIGSTAVSLKDFFKIPYSHSGLGRGAISGVELQANFTSQILSTALDGRLPIRVWPNWGEWAWILGWAYLSALLSWQMRSLLRSALGAASLSLMASGCCYLIFLTGLWWLPAVPVVLAIVGSSTVASIHRLQQEEKLKKSKEFLSSVINTIPDPIFVKDSQYRWIVLNEAYCDFIGYPLEMLLEKTAFDFFPWKEAEVFQQQDQEVLRTGKAQEHEENFTDAQGRTYQIATKRSLHRDSAGNIFLVGVIRDITDRKRLEDELRRTASELMRSNTELKMAEGRLRRLAYYDTLTGLPNRKFFQERFEEAIFWANSHHRLVALLFIDLDGFKQVNDTQGHDVGDQLLKAVALRLTNCLRGSDVVARLGGDEFTVLLPAIPTEQDAGRVAGKILNTLSQPFALNDHNVLVTASIGISLYPLHSQDIHQLMRLADIAMYQAKRIGKNQYALCAAEEPNVHPQP